MRKRIKMRVCALVLMGLTVLAAPAALAEEQDVLIPVETEGEGDTAVIQSFIYQWRYKVENGHLYKRLYNTTTERWVGDWILVA